METSLPETQLQNTVLGHIISHLWLALAALIVLQWRFVTMVLVKPETRSRLAGHDRPPTNQSCN